MKINKGKIKKGIQFITNPRLLLCLGIAWMITNGWSYLLLGLGTLFQNSVMIAIASGYLAFLWLPVSPEKIVTIAIAMLLLKKLFPNDEKTLGILKGFHAKLKEKTKNYKEKHKKKKASD